MLNDLEEFERFEADEKSISRQMPGRQWQPNVVKTPGKSGLDPTAPTRSEDTALYQLSQILNDKTDGSLVNFRRMPSQITQKTTADVDNGHSKECRVFDVVYTATLSRFGSGRVYAGLRRCMQTQSHPEHAAAKREHHRLFFFGPRKRGVRPHPPNPPWLRACNPILFLY